MATQSEKPEGKFHKSPEEQRSGEDKRAEIHIGDSEEAKNIKGDSNKLDLDSSDRKAPSSGAEISIDVEGDGGVHISVMPPTFSGDVQNGTQEKDIGRHVIPVPRGESRRVVIEILFEGPKYQELAGSRKIPRVIKWLSELKSRWPLSFDMTLFALALSLYLVTRIVGLSNYPIYFFSDEAVQTILAADFLRENFHNAEGEFLPTYFYNIDKYSLSTTVYLQILPYLLFGKSVFVTRFTSVLVTFLAAVFVGLILRDMFDLPCWWSGTLLLSLTPAWFLHSRTAFETVTMASFYTAGLYFYLRYRYGTPRYLYVALFLFALAFYSYNPGQVVVVVTGLLLLISDARYHWNNRHVAMRGFGILIISALPYIRFQLTHPTAITDHLSSLGSYWLQPITWAEKLANLRDEYLYGLSPGYWFISNDRDLERHRMKDYGHLFSAMLPFAALGAFQVLRNLRSSAHRVILISFLSAPAGAVLVEVAVTRALVMIIPAVLLTALGLIMIVSLLEKRLPRKSLSVGIFALLALINLSITWNAIQHGSTWFRNYGLTGLQYGAAQVFSAVDEIQSQFPDAEIIFSPTWTNGADMLARYFLDDPLPISMASISAYMDHRQPLNENMIFVMPEDEYELSVNSGKFTAIHVEHIVPYPDGRPGFYFIRLNYVDNIDEILAAEQALRRILREADVELDSMVVHIRYSLLDLGEISNLFDGNPRSVTRTFEANPYVVEISFPEQRDFQGLSMIIGDTEVNIRALVYDLPDAQPEELFYSGLKGSVADPQVSLNFGDTKQVSILYLEIKDLKQDDIGHVHIWEIDFHEGVNE